MKRGLTTAMACLLLVACGRGTDNDGPLETRGGARPEPVIIEGCLTAAGGEFVLTQLRGEESGVRPTTETYQLINADDELRPHVGREVRVSGEAEAPAVTNLREAVPNISEPVGTSGDAEVSSQESTRLERARMRVTSVTPTGDGC